MAKTDVDRNAPCPCGSGKKSKLCCGRSGHFGAFISDSDDPFAELRHVLERQTREDERLDEVGDIQWDPFLLNKKPLDDFQGLSPSQMHRFLYYPFESPQLVSYATHLEGVPSAPILRLFSLLANAIGETGVKTTELGNLPRKLTREVAREYLGEWGYREETEFGELNKETDFEPLHITRVISELSGLVRKYRKRFILGRDCRKLIAEGRWDAVYLKLFRTYVEVFNWDYLQFREAPHIVRDSFLFSLFLLHLYGGETRKQIFYEDLFMTAFPRALIEVQPRPYETAEDTLRFAYTRSVLIDFCSFFGLIKAQPRAADRVLGMDYLIRKLPLLDEVVRFQIRV